MSENQTVLSKNRTDARVYPRNLTGPLKEALEESPVVTIVGARQVGKSTLVKELIRGGHRAEYVTFDDRATREFAAAEPRAFLERFDTNVALDEIQLVPDLMPAIKISVDNDRRPGRFLLTGSANVLTIPRVAESLAGRMELHTLWPLSQGELERRRETFVDWIFDAKDPRFSEPKAIRDEVIARVLVGGYPEVVTRSPRARTRWFRSYVDTVIQRTAREISEIERAAELPRILGVLAGRPASILNRAELSRVLGINAKTLERYITLLGQIFLVRLIPAWQQNIGKRLTKHPKVLLDDTGLLGFLAGISADRFRIDSTLAGGVLENFVGIELLKQIGWSTHVPGLFHFHSHDGAEVDFVLERRDGSLVGIEVKAGATIDSRDFKGLAALLAARPKKLVRGVVLYTGSTTVSHGPGLLALPISALWRR